MSNEQTNAANVSAQEPIPNADLYAPEEADDNRVVLAIRVSKEMRDKFNALCQSRGTDMTRVLSRFIYKELQAAAK